MALKRALRCPVDFLQAQRLKSSITCKTVLGAIFISWERIFFLMSMVLSDSSTYHISHIFHARGMRSTSMQSSLSKVFYPDKHRHLFTFSGLRKVCIFTALCPTFNKPIIVPCTTHMKLLSIPTFVSLLLAINEHSDGVQEVVPLLFTLLPLVVM